MSSTIGEYLRVSIFGESHGPAIGCVINNLPAGENIDLLDLQAFLDRRSPARSSLTSQRLEPDALEIISGLYNNKTTGSPLAALIYNKDARSSDYSQTGRIIRPSHADYPAHVRYSGFSDMRGGGHFSGRLTAPLCIAGGLARQILKRQGIHIGGHLEAVGGVNDKKFSSTSLSLDELNSPLQYELPVLDASIIPPIKEEISLAANDGDSIGGLIECAVIGLPPGLGDPIFGGIENRIAGAVFGIPGVRGIEFGSGFEGAKYFGSKHNDSYFIADNKIETKTNHHGGILGGITTGMPLIFRIALKPTPSIRKAQQSVSLDKMEEALLEISGRHDPCIALRAVPVAEAVAAIVILDSILISKGYKL